MGSLNPEDPPKQELDDSGYVQEDASAKEASSADLSKSSPNLLDLSDDVLLYILNYCSPIDLKALGYTCSRLGALVLDRTLWRTVEARGTPTGRRRLQWLLTHALSAHTRRLNLSGYAREASGCLGYMSGSRDEHAPSPIYPTPEEQASWNAFDRDNVAQVVSTPRLFRLSAQALPRYGGGFPYWPEQMAGSSRRAPPAPDHAACLCPGPQVTLTKPSLYRLTEVCTALTELALDYVVIDCNKTNISMFPQTLRVLSLKGTKCFNLEKSFLYKIQDHLVHLEELDVSGCEWVEPACMLPLSKLPRLARLLMQHCIKLTEFVAYASLATRYGFKALKILDLRGSPVGDSEVSALGWLPLLEQLYLSPASGNRHADHAHFSREPPPLFTETMPWEDEMPEYYRSKYATEDWICAESEQRARPARDDAAPGIGSCVLLQHVGGVMNMGRADGEQPRACALHCQCQPGPCQYGPEINSPENVDAISECIRASLGYVVPNAIRRTINMYPDEVDYESQSKPGSSRRETVEPEPGCSKRKTDEHSSTLKGNSGTAYSDLCQPNVSYKKTSSARLKKRSVPPKTEPSTSKSDVTPDKNDQSDKNKTVAKSVNNSKKHQNTSSDDSSDDEALINLKNKNTGKCLPTKASQKHYDNIQRWPKSKESLSDFKKRLLYRSRHIGEELRNSESSSDDDDDDTPLVKRRRVDEAAGAARAGPKPVDTATKEVQTDVSICKASSSKTEEPPTAGPSTSKERGEAPAQRFVRFRHNQPPIVIEGGRGDNQRAHDTITRSPIWNRILEESSAQSARRAHTAPSHKGNVPPVNSPNVAGAGGAAGAPGNGADEQEPARHRILYVNVGRRRHAMYQIFLPEPVELPHRPLIAAMNLLYSSHSAPRLEYTSLVTDTSIRRFGRADGENINYVQIGPMGIAPAPYDDPNARPNRSNLRILSVTGFRHITNHSLTHLATAAPHLQLIDFTGTRVTESGVEHFRNIRPDCRVRYGPIDTPKEDSGRPHSR